MKIAFVLGAGANKELDTKGSMPLGAELASRIQSQLFKELNNSSQWPSGPISDTLSRAPTGLTGMHVDAMRRIEQGITYRDSIDEFLDEWNDLPYALDVGKVAIAYEILSSEAKTHLYSKFNQAASASQSMSSIRESWLGQIFRFANPGVRRRDVEKCLSGISFVTFNYDRCLEAALFSFLRYGQNLDQAAAREHYAQIPIFHAYGSLGELPEWGAQGVPYGESKGWMVGQAASKIRTFTEEVDSAHALAMRHTISEADLIVFLGFAYNDRNLDLIMPDELNLNYACIGSCIGIRNEEKSRIDKYFHAKGANIIQQDIPCSKILSEYRAHIFG